MLGLRADGGTALEGLGARTWRGGGVGASRAEEAGLRPVATQGEEQAGAAPGREGGEQSEEEGEHGGSEGGTWGRVFLVYTK